MRELLDALLDSAAAGRPAACCRLLETRGSTPQKAGATMLVFADGGQTGTLGGGCVEAEVKRRALAALGQSEVEVAKFQLDDDYGWDDGLICGGRMQVLIEPLSAAAAVDYFRALREVLETGRGATEAVVFDAEASGLPAAAAWLLDEEGGLLASSPAAAEMSGDVPEVVRRHLRTPAERPRPYAAEGIGFLTTYPRCRLVIVGGGHVGKGVADLAVDLDFDLTIVDDREEYVSAERFPRAARRLAGRMEQVLPDLEITPQTYCLIVTRGHNHDAQALYHLAGRGAAYVGMIGSRRKIRLIFDELLAEGIDPAALESVHAPVGLDIGSQTVPEIAVSIAAELVQSRNVRKPTTNPAR